MPCHANGSTCWGLLQALKEAGCDEVVLAINYRPQVGPAGGRLLAHASCRCPACVACRSLPVACGHVPAWLPVLQVMMDFLKEWEEKLGIKITCSQVESTAFTGRLGTAQHSAPAACVALPAYRRPVPTPPPGTGARADGHGGAAGAGA